MSMVYRRVVLSLLVVSASMGTAVHSVQSLFFAVALKLCRWTTALRPVTGQAHRRVRHLPRFAAMAVLAACGSDAAGPAVNPVPTLGVLSPGVVTAGAGDFTLTVHGSGFVQASLVRWNSVDLTTTLISDVELRALVPGAQVADAGVASVSVFNPAPGGGLSPSSPFEVRNPAPMLAGMSPLVVLAGASAMTVQVTGSGFVRSSVARWNGADLITTFLTSATLTAAVSASSLASAGTAQITIFNPGPGGGTSAAAVFTIENPVPAITALSPASRPIGSPAVDLQVAGTGFVPGSVVRWNGVDRPTGYVSPSQLTASLAASDFTTGAYASVTVFNPGPGGGTSQPRTFSVGNAIPVITAVTPDTTNAGGSAFVLTVDGMGFVSGAEVRWGSTPRPTTFVGPTRVTALIADSNIVSGGSVQVVVVNPAPGGGPSGPATVLVLNPVPTVTSLTPDTVTATSSPGTITVDGSGFVPGSSLRIDGATRTTSFVSAGRLTAYFLASDVATGGVRQVTVANTPPGGGTSSPREFVVVNPIASLTGLSPDNAPAGGGALTLTVSGSGLVGSSVVQWNGQDLVTSYLSRTSVRASVPATLLTAVGLASVDVRNPTPGGGTSAPLGFAVRAPLPVASSLSPTTASPGDPGFTLTVNGSSFVTGARVLWNGSARLTTFVSATQLTADIPASDLASTTRAVVTVENPAPGGGTSGPLGFTVGSPGSTNPAITSQTTLAIPTRDLLPDTIGGRLYASVPSTGGGYANMIVAIDPATGTVVNSVAAGSEPGELAISGDRQFLYVGLDGAPVIRRFQLPSLTRDLEIQLPRDNYLGSLYAEDIEVQPGAPHTIAVSLRNQGYSPRHAGVAIVDDSIVRPLRSQGHTGSNVIEFSSTPGVLFGHNNETTEFGFRRLAISAAGVSEIANTWGIVQSFGLDFVYMGGRAFFTNGLIVEPESRTPLGSCNGNGPVRPDPAAGRVYIINRATSELLACNVATYATVGALVVPSGVGADDLVRWAADGVAYRTASDIVILRTTLLR